MPKTNPIRSLLAMAGLSLMVGATAQTGTAAPGGGAGTQGGAMQRGSAATGAAVAVADRDFAEKAAAAGLAEVEGGRMAEQRASHDKVKQYGARMVQDHAKSNDELKQIAAGKGLQLPSAPDAHHQKEMARLQKLPAGEFDRAYLDQMVKDHRKTVADFKKQADSGKDPDLKAYAAKTLPTLQEHLNMAQAVQGEVRKAAKP